MAGFRWARMSRRECPFERESAIAFNKNPAGMRSRGGAFVSLCDWGAKGAFHNGTAFVGAAKKAILQGTKVTIRCVQARFLKRQSASCQRRQQNLKSCRDCCGVKMRLLGSAGGTKDETFRLGTQ